MTEVGTMKNFREKLDRRNVTPEKVTKSYEGCEQFLLSFGKAYICVAAMEFWGLQDLNSTPLKHIPPAAFNHYSLKKKKEYFDKIVGEFIDEFVMTDPDQEAVRQYKEWREYSTKVVSLDHDYAMKDEVNEGFDHDFPPDTLSQPIDNDKVDRVR